MCCRPANSYSVAKRGQPVNQNQHAGLRAIAGDVAGIR